MPDRDMNDWEALLEGHEVPNSHPQTVMEALMLRKAIVHGLPESRPILDAHAKDRLLARLEKEGVITSEEVVTGHVRSPRPEVNKWWQMLEQWLKRPVMVTAFATVALLLLVFNPWVALERLADGQKVLGITRAVSVHLVIDRKSAEEQVMALAAFRSVLSELEISPRYYEVGNNAILQFYISRPVPEPFGRVLQQYNLRLPPYQEEDSMLYPWVRHALQYISWLQKPENEVKVEFIGYLGR